MKELVYLFPFAILALTAVISAIKKRKIITFKSFGVGVVMIKRDTYPFTYWFHVVLYSAVVIVFCLPLIDCFL